MSTESLINHIVFILDASTSMSKHAHLIPEMVEKFRISAKQNPHQTNLISIYSFGDTLNKVHIFEKNANDPTGWTFPYHANGMTALCDAVGQTVQEFINVQAKFSTKRDENHSFLFYVLTDGEENQSRQYNAVKLSQLISGLNEAWTVATLVPDNKAAQYAKRYGIPADNIELWDISNAQSLEKVADRIVESFSGYVNDRTKGITRSTKMFSITSTPDKVVVKASLDKVKGTLVHAQRDRVIREFVESVTGSTYVKGSTYYELTKAEDLQGYKDIILVDRKSGDKFGGAPDQVRSMLNIDASVTRIKPDQTGYRIFVQSTSVNRKIPKGTSIFIKDFN